MEDQVLLALKLREILERFPLHKTPDKSALFLMHFSINGPSELVALYKAVEISVVFGFNDWDLLLPAFNRVLQLFCDWAF